MSTDIVQEAVWTVEGQAVGTNLVQQAAWTVIGNPVPTAMVQQAAWTVIGNPVPTAMVQQAAWTVIGNPVPTAMVQQAVYVVESSVSLPAPPVIVPPPAINPPDPVVPVDTEARIRELRWYLLRGMAEEPGADGFLIGLLTAVATVEAWLDVKAEATLSLADPESIPEELVGYLAAIVGIGSDLPAAFSLTIAEQRRLIPVAVALWKRNGTRRSWRDVVLFLTGARSLLLDWFHHRIVLGSTLELHLLPVPSTAPGGAYDNPETVSDVWIMDPANAIDGDLLSRWLGVVSAANERINMFKAALVEDLQIGTSLWTIQNPAQAGNGLRTDLVLGDDSTVGIVSPTANTYMVSSDVPIAPNVLVGLHMFALLAIEGSAEVFLFAQDDVADDAYSLLIDNDAGAGRVRLRRITAGAPGAVVATFTLPQQIVDLRPYRWSFDAYRLGSGHTEIAVQWEAVALGSFVDSSPGLLTDGRFGFRGGAGANDRAILQTALIYRHNPPRTRVGLDP